MRAVRTGVVVAVAATVLFCWLTVVMLRGEMAGFDHAIRTEVHNLATPWLTASVEALTWLGALQVLALVDGVAIVVFVHAGRRWEAKFVLLVSTGALLLENALKFSIQRPRPPPFFGTDPTTYSFPSGHALFSLCVYGALAAVLGGTSARRAIIWPFLAFLVVAIGGTRIYLGVHYPSDVIAGYLIGIAWLCTALAATGGRAGVGRFN